MIKSNYMDKLLDGVEVEWNSLGKLVNLHEARDL